MKQEIEPGIYASMPEEEYHAAAGLSCSGMKQLAVSPLNYWHHNLNPDRQPPEETYPQRFGKAVHCRLLEPARFSQSYAVKRTPEDYPGCLVTADDMKAWLAEQGLPATAKKKQELIDRIMAQGSYPPIWDLLRDDQGDAVLLNRDEMAALDHLAAVVDADPYASAALSGGLPEVSFFVREPETGVVLKARMDYVRPSATFDLKTFSNARGKRTDKAVFDAIYYENYHLQAVAYHTIRDLARQQYLAGDIGAHGVDEGWLKAFLDHDHHGFGFIFVESSAPFDMRIVQLRRSEFPDADPNVYWQTAAMQIAGLTAIYAECMEKYGDRPWREPLPPRVLQDTDIPQLMFS